MHLQRHECKYSYHLSLEKKCVYALHAYLGNKCVHSFHVSVENACVFQLGKGWVGKRGGGRKRNEEAASVLETDSSRLLPYNLDPSKRQFSRRTISGGEEETCVIHDSITDLWVVPETSLVVT